MLIVKNAAPDRRLGLALLHNIRRGDSKDLSKSSLNRSLHSQILVLPKIPNFICPCTYIDFIKEIIDQ